MVSSRIDRTITNGTGKINAPRNRDRLTFFSGNNGGGMK
jgi:hypothetical protein